MGSTKPTINDRMRNLIREMISLNIKYVDAGKEFERLFIDEMLRNNGYNRSEAAEKLGIHRNTLTYKIREYNLKNN
jgi:DNA-binding NtrC family response regulator